MKKFEFRKGSALLIVLGMVSFMVISAVSFSIFMRQSRAPSSHLRRQVSSRYLLKAALANAISRIDGAFCSYRNLDDETIGDKKDDTMGGVEGVFDDVYPGVGATQLKPIKENGNYWSGRVMTPFGPIDPSSTVATLTLEALAYLPPAIINEVRIDSRRTRTAQWRNLAYEMGRYAFTAVNVSDCFDINKLSGDKRRTSAPGQRISLGSLFVDSSGNSDAAMAAAFQKIKDRAGDIPFVSLADFNVVAGQSEFSPFCRYIGQSGSKIYNQSHANSLSNALFITDTWFPPTNRTGAVSAANRFDLSAGSDNQPFEELDDSTTLQDTIRGGNRFYKMMQPYIGVIGMGCLYDYLDFNSRPISFCIPTVETVPMVCGIGLAHNNQFTPKVEVAETRQGAYDGGEPVNENVTYNRVAERYALKLLGGNVALTGNVMFPFRRAKEKKYDTSGFKGEALVRIWCAPNDITTRLSEDSPIYPDKNAWQTGTANGIVTIKQEIKNLALTVKDEPKTEDAFGTFTEAISLPDVDMSLFWHVTDTKITKNPMTGGTTTEVVAKYYSLDGVKDASNALLPYDVNGVAEKWIKDFEAQSEFPSVNGNSWSANPTKSKQYGKDGAPPPLNETDYKFYIAVWVKIIDGDGKVVDIVPAKMNDDKEWGIGSTDLQGAADDAFGANTPILAFHSSATLKYSLDAVNTLKGEAATFEWESMFAADPRYNWAPECWFASSGENSGMLNKNSWIDAAGGILGDDGRDADIFMFCSDQEYLQSIGELQFISDVGWRSKSAFAEYEGQITKRAMPKNWQDCACRNYFWRSYTWEDLYDEFSGNGQYEIITGENDFRVNPFSDDTRIISAAIANTPYDYYIASSNEDQQVNFLAKADVDEAQKYAFNNFGSTAKMENDVVADIAESIRSKMREFANNGKSNWQEAYNSLNWFGGGKNDDQMRFLEVDLDDPLYSVDRKFLYSYWRECFQNRQQLFLVFIRAEPLSVGGSSGDAVGNAQLGARGVALVWRDPQPPQQTGGKKRTRDALTDVASWRADGNQSIAPHRTRILFYHQFD